MRLARHESARLAFAVAGRNAPIGARHAAASENRVAAGDTVRQDLSVLPDHDAESVELSALGDQSWCGDIRPLSEPVPIESAGEDDGRQWQRSGQRLVGREQQSTTVESGYA